MPERTVRELAEGWIAAFNARDLDAMLEMAADDIQFETLHRGTLGRDDLPAFLERQSYGVGLYIVTEDSQEREGYLVRVRSRGPSARQPRSEPAPGSSAG